MSVVNLERSDLLVGMGDARYCQSAVKCEYE
jgi:hypothetical protein